MSEEASENLIRVYLENNDYLVTMNKKIRIKRKIETKKGAQGINPAHEIDVIAVNLRTNDKIIGEVKGWQSGIHIRHFKKLKTPSNKKEKDGQNRLKIINDAIFRKNLVKKIENLYGVKGFRVVIYADHIYKNEEKIIKKFMEKEKFDIVTFDAILKNLKESTSKFAYSNDPIMQLLRIEKRLVET